MEYISIKSQINIPYIKVSVKFIEKEELTIYYKFVGQIG